MPFLNKKGKGREEESDDDLTGTDISTDEGTETDAENVPQSMSLIHKLSLKLRNLNKKKSAAVDDDDDDDTGTDKTKAKPVDDKKKYISWAIRGAIVLALAAVLLLPEDEEPTAIPALKSRGKKRTSPPVTTTATTGTETPTETTGTETTPVDATTTETPPVTETGTETPTTETPGETVSTAPTETATPADTAATSPGEGSSGDTVTETPVPGEGDTATPPITPTETPTETTSTAPTETTPVETVEGPTPIETSPSETTPTETVTDTSTNSQDIVDDGQTPSDADMTDKILQDLEIQAKNNRPAEGKKEYVAPPNYEYMGRGLVYNCAGKHWACVDGPSYKSCEDNASGNKFLGKTAECYPFNVYESPKGCENMQYRMVSSSAKTNFCQGD